MASYIDQISSLNPKIWFKFNETAGTPVNSGSLSCSLTATGTPSLNNDSSVDGRSIYLNGSSGYQLSNFPSYSLLDDRSFTVEVWFKSPTTGYTSDFSGHFFRIDTPNAGVPEGGMGFRIFGTGVGNSAFYGRLELYLDAGSAPFYNIVTPAGVSYNDNKWHHAVATINTTSMKIYVDGSLVASNNSITTSALDWDDLTGTKTVGYSTTTSEFFKGNLDEFAIYDRELTSSEINANYVAGSAVYASADVLTVSAAFPMPSSVTVINYAAAPMTASSTFGDHYASTISIQSLLNTYMGTLTLEQWYKFDEAKAITNYGTGGSTGWVFTGNSNCQITSGIQGSGALRTLATIDEQVYGLSTAPLSTEFTDGDFSVGFWTKRTSLEHAQVLQVSGTGDDSFTMYWNPDGYLNTNLRVSNTNHAIQAATDYTDGNWHYVAARKSGTTLQMWVEGTSIGTVTVNQDMANLNRVTFGGSNATNTEQIYISQFYVGTASNITSTEIANIWTYGQPTVQASAGMPMPVFSRNNALNTYILNNSPEFYFKMDEGTGAPINSGSVSCTLTQQGTNFTQNVTSPNYKAYTFTNRDTQFTGSWTAPTGTFTTEGNQTIVMYAKTGSITAVAGLGGAAAGGGAWGNGIFFQQLANGTIRLRLQNGTTSQDATTSVSFADSNYHMFVGVKNGNTLKLYVDGVERASNSSTSISLTDSGQFAIAGAPGSAPATLSRNLTIDEFAVFNTAFSAQDALEVFQKVANEMDWTATSTFVMPTNLTGTGCIVNASPMTASANMEKPVNFANHMEAFAVFQLPNFGATVNLNVNYGSEPFTASGVFHMPQYNIGEFNSSDTMTASALMVNPIIVTPGGVTGNPLIAQDATLVMPGIVTIKGARVFAETLTVRAFMPLPPAYFQLEDDPYYVRLFKQHSVINREDLNSTGLAGVKKSNLHFFNDVTADITIRSGGFLTDELPAYIFDEPGTIYLDENGNTIQAPATKREYAPSGNPLSTPTPMLSKGYFDPKQRAAVRVDNIQFPFDKSNSVDIFKPFSLEFTIKTTKANQIIALGRWESFIGYQRRISTIGLYNGKLYGMDAFVQIGRAEKIPYPSTLKDLGDLSTGYLLSNKRIDDGEWHHIVYQYDLAEERTQIWIDGILDRQILGITSAVPGSNGYAYVRPYVMGFNDPTGELGSDFQTSVWSYDPGPIVSRDNIGLNFIAYQQSEPIKAEVMTASITTATPVVKGNKARALMLYFWSTFTPGQDPLSTSYRYQYQSNTGARYTQFDNDRVPTDGNDRDTFFPISTWEDGVQRLYDWDVFPVDVQGFYTSRVVKEESYKNPLEHGTINGRSEGFRDEFDRRRYIDLEKDIIDLDSFDMICFRNYPNESAELDAYSRNEVVDQYFDLRESETFQAFLKSIRRAVDKGMSLFITNPQLAIDLNIIDKYEPVSELVDTGEAFSPDGLGDPWSRVRTDVDTWTITNPTAEDIPDGYDNGIYTDLYKNNRHRVLNTLTGLTDEPSYIKVEEVEFYNRDERDYGGLDRRWVAVQEKPNGLAIGDEFMFSSKNPFYIGVPLANIKAGRAITTFASAYRAGLVNTQNPYINYATTIAVRPGDVLNGTQVGGKIFVNLTEWIKEQDEFEIVELITPYWINKAVADGTIDEVTAAEYRQRTQYLPTPTAFQSHWSMNGENVTGSLVYYGNAAQKITVYSTASGAVRTSRKAVTRSGRRRSRDTGTAGDAFLSYKPEWGYTNPTMQVRCLDMTSRGLIWLSEKELYGVIPQRPLAITVDAEMVNPTVTADKDRVVYAEAMVANATTPEIGTVPNRLQLSLPMYAQARITDVTKAYYPEPYTTTAFMPQNVKVTSYDVDQVVLYIMHEDAVLYLREDVIK